MPCSGEQAVDFLNQQIEVHKKSIFNACSQDTEKSIDKKDSIAYENISCILSESQVLNNLGASRDIYSVSGCQKALEFPPSCNSEAVGKDEPVRLNDKLAVVLTKIFSAEQELETE